MIPQTDPKIARTKAEAVYVPLDINSIGYTISDDYLLEW